MVTLKPTSSLSLTTRKPKLEATSKKELANTSVSINAHLIWRTADSSDNEEPQDNDRKRKFVGKSSFADD